MWYRRKWVWVVGILVLILGSGLFWFAGQTIKYMRLISAGQLDTSISARERETVASIREVLAGERPTSDRRKRIEVSDGNPTLGDAKAKYKLVEFLDYQCPFSQQISTVLKQFIKDHPDVQLIVRDYPVSELHDHAEDAARATRCVFAQGIERYWLFHDLVFADQADLSPESLKQMALKTGIDPKSYDACLRSAATTQAIKKSMDDGVLSGVVGTPTFFLNGFAFPGVVDNRTLELVYQEFKKL